MSEDVLCRDSLNGIHTSIGFRVVCFFLQYIFVFFFLRLIPSLLYVSAFCSLRNLFNYWGNKCYSLLKQISCYSSCYSLQPIFVSLWHVILTSDVSKSFDIQSCFCCSFGGVFKYLFHYCTLYTYIDLDGYCLIMTSKTELNGELVRWIVMQVLYGSLFCATDERRRTECCSFVNILSEFSILHQYEVMEVP